ncbi:MAG: ribonuclease M5 [Bulleidia sp.]
MMEKKRIQEVIVVEGKHDTEKLRKYFDCDTIETNGTHLGKEIMDRIRFMAKSRGVIVFTDPDSPGNRIRHQIAQQVPECKHAFVQKEDARSTKKVGVEHAQRDVLMEAIQNCATFETCPKQEITTFDMLEMGLSGDNSQKRREWIGRVFHIGMGNAKTMQARLNGMHITKQSVMEALEEYGKTNDSGAFKNEGNT